jgi:predicted RNA-binding Zn ribbon-like protein
LASKRTIRHAGNLHLIAGNMALDFANTVDWHDTDTPREFLVDYGALLDWCVQAGLLDRRRADEVAATAAKHPGQTRAALQRGLELRGAIFRMFRRLSRGQPAEARDLVRLNRVLAAPRHRCIVTRDGTAFAFQPADDGTRRDFMLGPLAWSAAALLTSPHLDRLKMCEAAGCGWLFLDMSRKLNRRWCSMEDCGNREKRRRWVRRAALPRSRRRRPASAPQAA